MYVLITILALVGLSHQANETVQFKSLINVFALNDQCPTLSNPTVSAKCTQGLTTKKTDIQNCVRSKLSSWETTIQADTDPSAALKHLCCAIIDVSSCTHIDSCTSDDRNSMDRFTKNCIQKIVNQAGQITLDCTGVTRDTCNGGVDPVKKIGLNTYCPSVTNPSVSANCAQGLTSKSTDLNNCIKSKYESWSKTIQGDINGRDMNGGVKHICCAIIDISSCTHYDSCTDEDKKSMDKFANECINKVVEQAGQQVNLECTDMTWDKCSGASTVMVSLFSVITLVASVLFLSRIQF